MYYLEHIEINYNPLGLMASYEDCGRALILRWQVEIRYPLIQTWPKAGKGRDKGTGWKRKIGIPEQSNQMASEFPGQNHALRPDWAVVKRAPLFSFSRVLSSAPFFLLQNLPNLLSAKANCQQPQSPLPQLQRRCNCSSFRPLSSDTSSNMFRTAVRQSTRAVGAVSAAGRVTVVSLLLVMPDDPDHEVPSKTQPPA